MLTDQLRDIVGQKYVHVSESAKKAYTNGYRCGQGDALAVVRPGNLLELWKAAKTCVRANVIIIMQASNTGLTGGSTPNGNYDRSVVVIETTRLQEIFLLDNAEQVVCLPGSTLFDLERRLARFDREPHSEIGSSCLGASIVGGVCNNSGGALIRRGPAYTEAALFARVNQAGELELINKLGIELGVTPEEMLKRLEDGAFLKEVPATFGQACSARDYVSKVSDIHQSTPSRYNANPEFLYEASGSAGRVIVFALRLDTFPKSRDTRIIHVATNSAKALSDLRRSMLNGQSCVPISGEYLSREVFNLASKYGRDTFLAVRLLGTQRLPALFRAKRWVDRIANSLNSNMLHVSDRIMQWTARLVPGHLSSRIKAIGGKFAHHLVIKIETEQIASFRKHISSVQSVADIYVRECAPSVGNDLMLHRFAAAGAAIRFSDLNKASVGNLLAFDVALPRNAVDWNELLPRELIDQTAGVFLYGHFFCHVFHLDVVLKRNVCAKAFKQEALEAFEARGAECPAEHNVGHTYVAKPSLSRFYQQLDPRNALNPGIGMTSRKSGWK